MEEFTKPLRGYSEEPIFYVYVHKRPDGSIFYVGKGKDRRAWAKKDRNPHWRNVVDKYGTYDVEIVKQSLTEQESFEYEAELVKRIGIDNLTNQTLGGISTTGYRHTEETRKLQSEIMKQRLEQRPDLVELCYDNLQKLHHLQRTDENYKKQMSDRMKSYYESLSDEDKVDYSLKRTAWHQDEEKKKAAVEKMKISFNKPEHVKNLSNKAKQRWAEMSEEQRAVYAERSSMVINDPVNRKKLLELNSEKVVVNRKHLYVSKRSFLDSVNSDHAPLSKSFSVANEQGYDFCVFKGYFVEEYNSDIHTSVVETKESPDCKLDFDCLPRSKAVVMDESVIFLSMREASIFCKGKTIDATADFISKNMKIGKPAMGHIWREASAEEIKTEVFKRVKELNNKGEE